MQIELPNYAALCKEKVNYAEKITEKIEHYMLKQLFIAYQQQAIHIMFFSHRSFSRRDKSVEATKQSFNIHLGRREH